MSRARLLAAAVAAAALAAAAAVAVVATGESAPGQSGLAWDAPPRVVRHDTIATDRVLTAEVRNGGPGEARVASTRVVVRDRDGRPLRSATVFLRSFTHAVYPPGIEPDEVPESELIRSGRLLALEPGETAPVAIAWRQPRGAAPAKSVELGGATLSVPAPAGAP